MEPFLGEIRLFAFGYAPRGWALCNGQLLPINQNQALFSLLGTIYGGDGRTSFALPNFQGRVPLHAGNGFMHGELGGEETHLLNPSEMPAHTHGVNAFDKNGDSADGTNAVLANAPADIYVPYQKPLLLTPAAVGPAGGSQGHENMSPFTVLNFAIAIIGIYPSRN